MSEHVCYCPECAPEAFYSGPSLGSRHVATRLARKLDELRCRVYCDDQEIELCFECYADKEGWVAYYTDEGKDKIHTCSCGRSACSRVRFGDVQLKWRDEVRVC